MKKTSIKLAIVLMFAVIFGIKANAQSYDKKKTIHADF